MTSEERRAARRQRREAVRAEKQRIANARYDNFDSVTDANALIKAARLSKKTVGWKASVQRYFMNLLRNTFDLRDRLRHGKSVIMGFICFTLCERGKSRNIRSVHFKERVVQRSVCDNALVPVLSRSLIYDNGASMRGKGIHFAIFRLSRQLHEYFRKYGNKGFILQVDFSGYFDNIQHGPVLEMLKRYFHDEKLVKLVWEFVKSFGEKSLGIGSQVSQILAVSYPNRVDHYAREVLRIPYSGRYMDDSYYIHPSREYLEYALEQMRPRWEALGIRLNPKKTQIIPLEHFIFLKVRFHLTNTGRVILKPNRNSVTRERRKLRSFADKVRDGEMTMNDVRSAYASWYGYLQHLDTYKILRATDKLYFDLFGEWPKHKKKRKKRKEHYRA